jgi:hypothetical protein
MTMSMDLTNVVPRTQDGDLLKSGGITLNFHAHVDLHITVVRPPAGGMEIDAAVDPLCSETGQLPVTHPGNMTRAEVEEKWLMKNHPYFAAYAAKLRRELNELEAGPSTAEQDEIDDEDEPTDEAEAEEQARRRWPFVGRRKAAAESVAS